MTWWRGFLSGSLAAALIAAGSPAALAADNLAGITDPGLRACITTSLASLHQSDPAKLESLWCYSESGVVKDLAGLDGLTRLKELGLTSSQVTDVSVLAKLPRLRRVALHTTAATLDPTPLTRLPGLDWLTLNEPARTDLTFLASIPALTTLDLAVAPEAGFDPVLSIPSLQTLILSVHRNDDLGFLAGLPAGFTVRLRAMDDRLPVAPRTERLGEFSVNGDQLTSLDGLENIDAESGKLWSAGLTDISAVPAMGFTALSLLLPAGADLTTLAELTSLRELELLSRPASLAPLCRLPRFEKLSIAVVKQIDLRGLAGCASLATLNLRHKGITDISPLRDLPALRTLDLTGNAVTDLSPLGGLPRLTVLNAAENPVTTLGGPGFPALEALELPGAQLTSLAALNGGSRLMKLNLAGNAIVDIAPLADLPDGAVVDLSGNRIHDFSPLAGWKGTLNAVRQEVSLPDTVQNVPFPIRLLDHHGKPLTSDSAGYVDGALVHRDAGLQHLYFWSGRSDAGSPITLTVIQRVAAGKKFALATKPKIPWADPRIGKTIKLTKPASWRPTPARISYRWFRDATPIDGATSRSYTPVAADAGSSLSVEMTAHRPGYADARVMSNYTDNIPYRTLRKTPAPKLERHGKLTVGSLLTARPGTWDSGVKLDYQWQRDKKNIPGATSATYQVKASDAGHKLRVRVRGSKAGYQSSLGYPAVTRYSRQVTPAEATFAASSRPRISGTAMVGAKLAAIVDWEPAATLKYQWYRDGKRIKGATEPEYTVKRADSGHRITVRVTASKAGYATVVKTSARTGKVTAAA